MENTKTKLKFLLRYYISLILCFVPLRLLFLLINGKEAYTHADYADVAFHGLTLDIAVAGYLTIIPLLLTMTSTYIRVPMHRLLTPYNFIVSIVIASAFIADISLYPFWDFKLDASFLIYLDSPTNAFASVSKWYIIGHLLLSALLCSAIYLLLRWQSPNTFKKSSSKIAETSLFVIVGGVLFLCIRGGVTESTNNIGKAYYSDRQFLNHSAVNPIFSFIYSMGKREDYSEAYHFFNPGERAALFNGLYPQDSNITDTLLDTTRPNIVTIIFEGMGSALIESLGGKSGITPNFDRIAQEGVLFTNCHANSYRTDRGVLCTLSGYPSFPKTSVMKSPVKSHSLPSIASSLAKIGYHNTFLYGGDINFTNMKSYLFSTGYNTIISDKDFTRSQQETHQWGVTDHITFDTLMNIIENSGEGPWHITYLTLSSHEPWTVPYNRIKEDKIANSFAYTDSCFGAFIDRLKASRNWENTLIIGLPDHTLARYPERQKGDEEIHNKIPILLTGGAIHSPKQIDKLCNQSDLPATLLAQLQLPTEEFEFSRNILGPEYRYPFAYHSYNNGISFIDSTGITVLDLDSYQTLTKTPGDCTEQRLKRAKAILQTTYDNYTKR